MRPAARLDRDERNRTDSPGRVAGTERTESTARDFGTELAT
jgi:hypothetical protein